MEGDAQPSGVPHGVVTAPRRDAVSGVITMLSYYEMNEGVFKPIRELDEIMNKYGVLPFWQGLTIVYFSPRFQLFCTANAGSNPHQPPVGCDGGKPNWRAARLIPYRRSVI